MFLEALHDMSNKTTVGELIAAFLEQCGVQTAFGVISIHNMPILDAIHNRGKIRYVGARGEAGAVNMADGLARVSGGLGVAFTSTGTAAGNAAGAMVEALTAGTALLHVTGQIETEYLDKDLAYIHEAPDQLSMLSSISKAAFRVRSVETALPTIREAVRVAQTAPSGRSVSKFRSTFKLPKLNGPPIWTRRMSPRSRIAASASRSWPSNWQAQSARCCGWAAVRVTRVLPLNAWWRWALAS
jgi:Thiamine pyrophosphate-requiring enzymes [acetolactate synthase, pyruvate dehydrogenase (cytochrome), glyoxylate carboligase, phosphonopyruvate decarboxylase]